MFSSPLSLNNAFSPFLSRFFLGCTNRPWCKQTLVSRKVLHSPNNVKTWSSCLFLPSSPAQTHCRAAVFPPDSFLSLTITCLETDSTPLFKKPYCSWCGIIPHSGMSHIFLIQQLLPFSSYHNCSFIRKLKILTGSCHILSFPYTEPVIATSNKKARQGSYTF